MIIESRVIIFDKHMANLLVYKKFNVFSFLLVILKIEHVFIVNNKES